MRIEHSFYSSKGGSVMVIHVLPSWDQAEGNYACALSIRTIAVKEEV